MLRRIRAVWPAAGAILCAVLAAGPVPAQDRAFGLAVPGHLAESGFLDFVLPRFSLKTSVRVTVLPPADAGAHAALGPDKQGRAVFTGQGETWRLAVLDTGNPHVARFSDWLSSDPGQAAVAGFEVDGAAPFGPPEEEETQVVALDLGGDAARGADLSLSLCGRCHVVGDVNRLDGIGSTPSFAVLRTFGDWQRRFTAFYALNPHPSFTQVADVTPPFDPMRPPAIAPVEMSLDQLDDIVAYVAQIPPADLGPPIAHQ